MCRGAGWNTGVWPRRQHGVGTVKDCATECSAAHDCTAFDFDSKEGGRCFLFGNSAVNGDGSPGATCYKKQAGLSIKDCREATERDDCLSSEDGRSAVSADPKCCWGSTKFSGGSDGYWCQAREWISADEEMRRIDTCLKAPTPATTTTESNSASSSGAQSETTTGSNSVTSTPTRKRAFEDFSHCVHTRCSQFVILLFLCQLMTS